MAESSPAPPPSAVAGARADASPSPARLPPPPPGLISRIDAALVDHVLALKPQCRRLNLSHNAIAEVLEEDRDALTRLAAHLSYLNVSFNALRALPPAFGEPLAARLLVLDVSHNQLCVWAGGTGVCARCRAVACC
jgi:hypothetical protein